MSLRERMNKAVELAIEVDKVRIERNLNLANGLSEAIAVKQFDHNSRVLNLTLEKSIVERLDLANMQVYLIVKRPDNVKIKLKGIILSTLDGEVEFSFTQDSLAVSGSANCEVVIVGVDNSTLSFPLFTITIQESIYDEMIYTIVNNKDDEFTSIEDIDIADK